MDNTHYNDYMTYPVFKKGIALKKNVMKECYIALACLFLFAACKKNDGLPPALGDMEQSSPKVDFSLSYGDSGTVVLTNTSEEGGWPLVDWGDGTRSENLFSDSIAHRYTYSDTFSITLTEKNSAGEEFKKVQEANVTVPFINNFELKYMEPDEVQLTNLSFGETAGIVDWGDGSPVDTIKQNVVTHQYARSDLYRIALTINDPKGRALKKTDSIQMHVIAMNHEYSAVFPTEIPNYSNHPLYFVGYRRPLTPQLVWKFDFGKDSLVSGFPKPVTEEFNLPPGVETIEAVVWYNGVAYFTENGNIFTYDFTTNTAGSVMKITDLIQNWPANFPTSIEAGFFATSTNHLYLFAGGRYIEITGTTVSSGPTPIGSSWHGLGDWDLPNRPLNGAYFNPNWRMFFFSKDEMTQCVYGGWSPEAVFKIKDKYPGL